MLTLPNIMLTTNCQRQFVVNMIFVFLSSGIFVSNALILLYYHKGRKQRCCDNSMPETPDSYIARLEAEKKAMEARVAEIQAEIRTINNLIYRRKSEMFAESREEKINEKNVDRLFFETLIMDAISNAKRGLRTGEIHTAITKFGYGLNYNTLRSYVAKMRDKCLIKKATPSSYYWVVAGKHPKATPPDASRSRA